MRTENVDQRQRKAAADAQEHYPALHVRTAAAARHLGLAEKTLANWRSAGKGPRYSRIGRTILYRLDDLDRFVEGHYQELS